MGSYPYRGIFLTIIFLTETASSGSTVKRFFTCIAEIEEINAGESHKKVLLLLFTIYEMNDIVAFGLDEDKNLPTMVMHLC